MPTSSLQAAIDRLQYLGPRCGVREAAGRKLHLKIADDPLGLLLEGVDPGVAHTVAKLLLLSPQHLQAKVCISQHFTASQSANKITNDDPLLYMFRYKIHTVNNNFCYI